MSSDNEIKAYCLDRLLYAPHLIENNNSLTEEQKTEILIRLNAMTADDCHIRHYRGDSNQNMHKCHVDAYIDQSASREHISDFHAITFCVVHGGFNQLPSVKTCAKPGEVYVIFYTRASGDARTINKESRISAVNDRTHFTIQPTEELLDCPAGGIYGFSPMILTDAHNMYIELDHFIEFAKRGMGIISRRLTSLRNGEYIMLPRNIYGPNLENLKEIFIDLEDKHSVKISYGVKKRRPQPAPLCTNTIVVDHELTHIEWISSQHTLA